MKKPVLLVPAAIFTVFAYLQLNDPDPVHWTLGYLAVAVSFVLTAFGRCPPWWRWAVTAVFGAWLLLASPGIVHWVQQDYPDITGEMKASMPVIEDAREFLGLLIAFCAMLPLALADRKP